MRADILPVPFSNQDKHQRGEARRPGESRESQSSSYMKISAGMSKLRSVCWCVKRSGPGGVLVRVASVTATWTSDKAV